MSGSGAARVHVFRTDDTLIPGSRTLDGKPFRVIDGRFEFASFVLPAGVTVRFEGPHPARILVRGKVEIHGTLDLTGRARLWWRPQHPAGRARRAGGQPGAGGGKGGDGGNEPGRGGPQGQDGQELQMPPRHARSGWERGTGGRGEPGAPAGPECQPDHLRLLRLPEHPALRPRRGRRIVYAWRHRSIVMTSPPNWSLKTPAPQPVHGAPVNPSSRIPYIPLLIVPQTIEQLVLGGAGGGGAGVSGYGSPRATPAIWSFGNGGGGGGGGIALRSGSDLLISATGSILAAGGAGGAGGLAPGGGGGGGTILLQSGTTPVLKGSLDLRGGVALAGRDLYDTASLNSAAGGDGFLRVEAIPSPSAGSLGAVTPSPSTDNVGLLTDWGPGHRGHVPLAPGRPGAGLLHPVSHPGGRERPARDVFGSEQSSRLQTARLGLLPPGRPPRRSGPGHGRLHDRMVRLGRRPPGRPGQLRTAPEGQCGALGDPARPQHSPLAPPRSRSATSPSSRRCRKALPGGLAPGAEPGHPCGSARFFLDTPFRPGKIPTIEATTSGFPAEIPRRPTRPPRLENSEAPMKKWVVLGSLLSIAGATGLLAWTLSSLAGPPTARPAPPRRASSSPTSPCSSIPTSARPTKRSASRPKAGTTRSSSPTRRRSWPCAQARPRSRTHLRPLKNRPGRPCCACAYRAPGPPPRWSDRSSSPPGTPASRATTPPAGSGTSLATPPLPPKGCAPE
jgi:hypothetical protein